MKTKFMTFAMSMALLGTVSCSKNDFVEENKSYLADLEKSQYAANYVQQYGEVSSTQSWDFSTISNTPAATRAGESLSWRYLDPVNDWLTRWAFNDKAQVIKAIDNAEVKTFNPYLSVDLYPAYSYVRKK